MTADRANIRMLRALGAAMLKWAQKAHAEGEDVAASTVVRLGQATLEAADTLQAALPPEPEAAPDWMKRRGEKP